MIKDELQSFWLFQSLLIKLGFNFKSTKAEDEIYIARLLKIKRLNYER